ncbi:MAG TPA: LLM class flavin-dependent oxidoreductase [Actinomycetota bacterium]|nr:LLM class flavin-dependent oxidoreductase [Actinomycetota bacterium]
MRIGLALPHYDYSFPDGKPLSWSRLVDAAQGAEALGFDSVWVSDHFFLDLARYGGPADPSGTVEPFTALAALATATERVRLGTLVACAPFRHPAHVAKMATAIDLISGGRFDLGLGAGWYEPEFGAFGYELASTGERFAMLEESVQVVAGLFAEGPFTHEGKRFQIDGAYNHPRPAQPGGPPVWVGGKGGDRLLRLVARHASGWNTVWKRTPESFAERAAKLRLVAEAEGRDPGSIRLSIGLYTLVGEDQADLGRRFQTLQRRTPGAALDGQRLDEYARETLTGTAQACLEKLAAFAEAGAEELIVGAGSVPFSVADWSMVELISEALIPQAHEL